MLWFQMQGDENKSALCWRRSRSGCKTSPKMKPLHAMFFLRRDVQSLRNNASFWFDYCQCLQSIIHFSCPWHFVDQEVNSSKYVSLLFSVHRLTRHNKGFLNGIFLNVLQAFIVPGPVFAVADSNNEASPNKSYVAVLSVGHLIYGNKSRL